MQFEVTVSPTTGIVVSYKLEDGDDEVAAAKNAVALQFKTAEVCQAKALELESPEQRETRELAEEQQRLAKARARQQNEQLRKLLADDPVI